MEYRITGWFRSKDNGKWNAYVSRRKIAGTTHGDIPVLDQPLVTQTGSN